MTDALMFGEDASDQDDEPRADPRLDAGDAAQPDAVQPVAVNTPQDLAAPKAVSSPDKPASSKVVGIVGNTPHTHTRDDDQDDQDNPGSLDWEAIGQDFAAGVLSVRAIARAHGCHPSSIDDHAKRYGWTRNLTRQVQQRAQSELTFGSPLEGEGQKPGNQTGDPHAQEQAIAQAASVQVQVVQAHRKDLAKLRALQARLTEQAEAFFAVAGKDGDLIIDLGTLQTAVQVVESLARTTGRVIPLERAAFNIDAKQGPATEAQAIERRVQAAADRKRASPGDPQAIPRATQVMRQVQADTRAINDKRRADKLAGQEQPAPPAATGQP